MLLNIFMIIGYIVIVAAFFYAFYYAASTFLEKTGTLQIAEHNDPLNSALGLKTGVLPRTIVDDPLLHRDDQKLKSFEIR